MKITEKERAILEAAWKYPTTEEAAKAAGVSVSRYRGALCTIYRVLDVTNKTAAIRKAMELGLIEVLS
jgi:DNA-binding NarL/FixJ family response regulator